MTNCRLRQNQETNWSVEIMIEFLVFFLFSSSAETNEKLIAVFINVQGRFFYLKNMGERKHTGRRCSARWQICVVRGQVDEREEKRKNEPEENETNTEAHIHTSSCVRVGNGRVLYDHTSSLCSFNTANKERKKAGDATERERMIVCVCSPNYSRHDACTRV